MILFTTRDAARLPSGAAGWIYLGKDLEARENLERRLGRPPHSLRGLLHEESRRLRRAFLDLVASLGRGQDPWSWWAGTLAWKNHSASDLFLLCCYQAVCARLALEPRPPELESLAVVIEDDWLFAQLRESLAGREGVSFVGEPLLPWLKLKAAARGAAARIKWLAVMLSSRLRQAWHSRRRPPALPGKNGVALYSFLLERSLAGTDGWRDLYMDGLAEELRAAGAETLRLTDASVTGFERELAQRHRLAAPLILWASWRAFLETLAALPPRAAGKAELEGLPIGLLLKREWWSDVSRSSRCSYLLLADAARGLFSTGRFKTLVAPWENQPAERMLVLAAGEAGMRTVGYQHTTAPSFELAFFLGEGEAGWAPLPDIILTSGPRTHRLLEDAGYPPERLRLAGSRRYPGGRKAPKPGPAPERDILVVLPIGLAESRHMVAAVQAAARALSRRMAVKPHPAHLDMIDKLGFRGEIEARPMDEALGRCAAVVFTASTAGIESLARGLAALRYRPELLLDVDPCDFIPDSELPTASEWDLRDKLAALPSRKSGVAPSLTDGLFSPVDPTAWREAILRF